MTSNILTFYPGPPGPFDTTSLEKIARSSCDSYEECFDGEWGPTKYFAMAAMYFDYCRRKKTTEFIGNDYLTIKEIQTLIFQYFGGEQLKNHRFEVLQKLHERRGMLDKIGKRPMKYSLNQKGFDCAACIIANRWVPSVLVRE